jgi:hypothetical protein
MLCLDYVNNRPQLRAVVERHAAWAEHRPGQAAGLRALRGPGESYSNVILKPVELEAKGEKLEAVIATERERADRAVAAFESLAPRLEAMAEAPWWRRLKLIG